MDRTFLAALPCASVVVRVREYMTDEKLAAIVVKHPDQSVLVPTDIKDRELPHLVGTSISLANVDETDPVRSAGDAKPSSQRCLGLRMHSPELTQLFLADDVDRAFLFESPPLSFASS